MSVVLTREQYFNLVNGNFTMHQCTHCDGKGRDGITSMMMVPSVTRLPVKTLMSFTNTNVHSMMMMNVVVMGSGWCIGEP